MDVLLVEDNPADMRLVREALHESAAEVDLHWAATGADTLDRLRGSGTGERLPRPDLVLLDLNLQGMGGKEVLDAMKRDIRLASIPVVVLSSSAAPQDVRDAYRLHANAYMIKPCDYEGYLSLVEAIRAYWFGAALLPSGPGG